MCVVSCWRWAWKEPSSPISLPLFSAPPLPTTKDTVPSFAKLLVVPSHSSASVAPLLLRYLLQEVSPSGSSEHLLKTPCHLCVSYMLVSLHVSQHLTLLGFTCWTLLTKLRSSKMAVVIIDCVALAHSRHLNSWRCSKLNVSSIICVGVCLCHLPSFLTGLPSPAVSRWRKTHLCAENTKYCWHILKKGVGRMGYHVFRFSLVSQFRSQLANWPAWIFLVAHVPWERRWTWTPQNSV